MTSVTLFWSKGEFVNIEEALPGCHHRHLLLVSSRQVSCWWVLLGPISKNIWKSNSDIMDVYTLSTRSQWGFAECLVWVRQLFADLHSSPKTLRHLLLQGQATLGGQWSHTFQQSQEEKDICSCLGKATPWRLWCKLMCDGPRSNNLLIQPLCLLPTCSSSKEPTQASDTQLLAGRTDSTENQLVERYTSTNFGQHLISPLLGTIVSLLYDWLGVCYFVIA